MASDDESKDEELVDFEGSDYELDGEYDELDALEENEEEGVRERSSNLQRSDLHTRSDLGTQDKGAREGAGNAEDLDGRLCLGSETPEIATFREEEAAANVSDASISRAAEATIGTCKSSSTEMVPEVEASELLTLSGSTTSLEVPEHQSTSSVLCQHTTKKGSDIFSPSRTKEFTESGDIEVEVEDKEENCVPGLPATVHVDGESGHYTSEPVDNRTRKHNNSDLEDGELVESAVPQSYGFDAVEDSKEESEGPERKRRKDRSASGLVDRVDLSDIGQTGKQDMSPKQLHNFGGDKAPEHFGGLSSAGGRGLNMRMVGLAQGNFSPGIMGPGRPFMPLGIGSLAHGFRPFGGMAAHGGRPQVHLQDVLAQEQLLRAHALKLAHETLANAMRVPITRPFGACLFRPFLGLDTVGPGPHAPKHFLRPPPDLMLGHMSRGDSPNLDTSRGGCDRVGGLREPSLQEFSWTAAPLSGDLKSLKRGRARGQGIRTDAWGNGEPFGLMPGGLHPQAMIMKASHMNNLTSDEVPFYHEAGPGASHVDRNAVHNQFDARWKIERERMLRSGLPQFRTFDNDIKFADNSMELRKNVSGKPLASQDSSRSSGSLAGRLGPAAEAKEATPPSNSVGGSNVIKLLQPVPKSRILTVSGLPEETPMSTVAEVFEKLGKITDFKKHPKGDTFTISYSNETEAVSAKRSLHRSYLAGKQITVAYVHEYP